MRAFQNHARVAQSLRGTFPDCRAGLAVEDRDLLAECDPRDYDGVCILSFVSRAYPPLIGAGRVILVNPLAN